MSGTRWSVQVWGGDGWREVYVCRRFVAAAKMWSLLSDSGLSPTLWRNGKMCHSDASTQLTLEGT